MKPLILTIDQGSTESKAALVSPSGLVGPVEREPVSIRSPRPGWVESDPEELWRSARRAAERALRDADVAGMAIANQRSTVVFFDRTDGRAVMAALSWQDLRAAELISSLGDAAGRIRRTTGLAASAHYAAGKIRWALERDRSVRALARRGRLGVATVNSWLVWRFTRGGSFVTDPTNAGRMLLLDLETLRWDPWLLGLFGVEPSVLPEVRATAGDFGVAVIGSRRIPIVASIGDQQAAFIGLGCRHPGDLGMNLGTGGFVGMAVHGRPPRIPGLLTSVLWNRGSVRRHLLEGTVNAAGRLLEWLEGTGLCGKGDDLRFLGDGPPPGLTFVPALQGLGAPHFRADVHGEFRGLTLAASRRDLAAAALFALMFRLREIVDLMPAGRRRTVRAAGGLTRRTIFMERLAAVLGRPIRLAADRDATLRGAGLLGALSAGLLPNGDLPGAGESGEVLRPGRRDPRLGESCAQWREAMARALCRGRGGATG